MPTLKLFFLLFIGNLVFTGCVDEQKILNKKKAEIWENSTFDWRNPKFNTVKAYYYNTYKSSVTGELIEKEFGSNMIINGQLNKATWIKSEKLLNKNYIKKLKKIVLGDCNADPEFCYDPHHGLVFYDPNGFAIASISICFQCSIVEYEPSNGFYEGQCLKSYKKLFDELGIPNPKNYKEYSDYADKIDGIN